MITVVYVDAPFKTVPRRGWPYRSACHMMASRWDHRGLLELHEVAEIIGLKRQWFQDTRVPHYDLVPARRKRAVELGLVTELSRTEMGYAAVRTRGRKDDPEFELELGVLNTHLILKGS